jgi:hypothetical protein
MFHYLSNDINFVFCMLMIFNKKLVKLDIVWLSKTNISLNPWDGGSTSDVPYIGVLITWPLSNNLMDTYPIS